MEHIPTNYWVWVDKNLLVGSRKIRCVLGLLDVLVGSISQYLQSPKELKHTYRQGLYEGIQAE